MAAKKYDSTVARIAGNVAAGMWESNKHIPTLATDSVRLARAIIAEVERTEPEADPLDTILVRDTARSVHGR